MNIQMPDMEAFFKRGAIQRDCGIRTGHAFVLLGYMWAFGDSSQRVYRMNVYRCDCGKNKFENINIEPCPKNRKPNKIYK